MKKRYELFIGIFLIILFCNVIEAAHIALNNRSGQPVEITIDNNKPIIVQTWGVHLFDSGNTPIKSVTFQPLSSYANYKRHERIPEGIPLSFNPQLQAGDKGTWNYYGDKKPPLVKTKDLFFK